MDQDHQFMELALKEAEKGRYQTWQNPMVGAVIVKNGQILATGYHHHFGENHAERDAISKLSPEQLSNSTLYVTLEPCCHYGKQPPCADLIVASHIKRVVIAQIDPHSLVTGKGIQRLKDAGIKVTLGVMADEATHLNEFYSFFYQHQRPWITLKQAVSLDFKIGYPHQRTSITNQTVYDKVHAERSDYQAILIGSTTALVDDPTLHASEPSDFPPVRVVLDRQGRLADRSDLRLFSDQEVATWIFTKQPGRFGSLPDHVKLLQTTGDISDVVKQLADAGIQSVYVEGGAKIHEAFWQSGMVDELLAYISPQFLGQDGISAFMPTSPYKFNDVSFQQLANNIRIEGKITHV